MQIQNTQITSDISQSDIQISNENNCIHCGSRVPLNHDGASDDFCCNGCETVYKILSDNGLSFYYKLREKSASQSIKPIVASKSTYAFLDDPEFLKLYSTGEGSKTIQFYLEGIHCIACLWLIEKLPEFVSGVTESRLDMGRSIAVVTVSKGTLFSEVARVLEKLGYRPHTVRRSEDALRFQKNEFRVELLRIGIAGFCSGNIMLMVTSIYGGAIGNWGEIFKWLSFGFFLPVLTYCALPFYRTTLASIISKSLSIDVPIVLAILVGSAVSFQNLFTSSPHIYFDSLAMLVFLLLASRFALKGLQQKNLSVTSLLGLLSPSTAKKIIDQEAHLEVRVETLLPGDRIWVEKSESIPVDGVVLELAEGDGLVQNSLLTGESYPVQIKKWDDVYAGTINEGERIQIRVKSVGHSTRLGCILKEVEESGLKKAKIVSAADRLSRYFLTVVFVLAIATLFLSPNIAEGINRALALIIVTCPCALALATPLTMTVSIQKALKQGIIIKNADLFEKLRGVRTLFLDKTGTLTKGHFEVIHFETIEPEIFSVILALELKSKHPIAKSLVRYCENKVDSSKSPVLVSDFLETFGRGVQGKVLGQHYEIRGISKLTLREHFDDFKLTPLPNYVGVFKDGVVVAEAILGDELLPRLEVLFEKIRQLEINPMILSGDQELPVTNLAKIVKVPLKYTHFLKSPEEKLEIIRTTPHSMMVGDGANDAAALALADVGVAVHGSMEVSLQAADAYLSKNGIESIIQLIELSRETMHVVYRNFGISLIYNITAGVLSMMGLINPLLAALFMPLSAVSVFASSVIRRNKIQKTRVL